MTQPTLRPGQIGAGVKALQDLLNDELALDPPLTVDGHYGPLTLEAVYAFQASAVGPDGSPLTIDGIVGPLTWWALTTADQTKAFRLQGPVRVGEARCALGARTVERAIEEMRSGARERGANNAGDDVARYLAPLGRSTGAWCAGFVSYCVWGAVRDLGTEPPFAYGGTAKGILRELEQKGLAGAVVPQAGDLAFWWRVSPTSWQGHVEIVTDYQDGVLWTIGGNRGSYPAPVRQFTYVVERESRMIGFGELCAA